MALVPVGKICGSAVTDTQGEALGQIVEVMIDEASGGIGYVVLSHGGTLGVGEKLFAVPWASLTPGEGGYALAVGAERLADADGFDKDAWPTAPDPFFS